MALKFMRFKATLSTSVMTAALLGGGLATAPTAAAAEPRPSFQIFYGQDCATAYRTYLGPTTLGDYRVEDWINDTFNASRASSPGYGQLIRANAASVRLQPRTSVTILDGQGDWWWKDNSSYSTSKCLNFASLRNNNYKFEITMYNTAN